MKNPRITAKERNLLKGAIRRVFSRSDLRKEVLLESLIEHYDASRPRVKKWSRCFQCKQPTPTYLAQVDHVDPIVPVTTRFENMSLDDLVDRVWCDKRQLQVLCTVCHTVKTKRENAERRNVQRGKKVA